MNQCFSFLFPTFLETCYDGDQSHTLSHSVNGLKRKRRWTSAEADTPESEMGSLYTKIDELQTDVLSQQQTLKNIVNKVDHY
jgi:hypothetical protein